MDYSLEVLLEKSKKGVKFPSHVSLGEYEEKLKRIARRFGGRDKINMEGSHRIIKIAGRAIVFSPRQKGKEKVVSKGVLEENLEGISTATEIPKKQLEFYIIGKGKLYKNYKREFEKKYEI